MRAEERACLTIDGWERKTVVSLYGKKREALQEAVTQAILDARREAIEDCAAVADRWHNDVKLDAPCLPHEIARAIRALKEA